MTAIALQHREEILERIGRGEPITAIAQSLGYKGHSGIIERLGEDKDYQAALRSGIVGKIEKREAELECASDNVTVTRADRLLGHARWWAERLDPDRFGGKQTITVNQGVTLDQALEMSASALLNKMRVVSDLSTDETAQNEGKLLIP